ncbi:MAG: hypothetical protein JSU72_13590 [Deltaproteobacteria bacterium]|nr:MAG: hypothetical protein JSU72_13590 [Deltaproteobacteria bacterium]
MNTLEFSVTLNFSLFLQENQLNISLKNVDLKPAILSLPIEAKLVNKATSKRKWEKKTIFDIVLQTAKEFVERTGANEFSAADLFHLAKEQYPDLKRNSFAAHVIAATPDHTSYHHYTNRRDFFTYRGNGRFKIANQYLVRLQVRIDETKAGTPVPLRVRPSDQVRKYAKRNYIDFARERNESTVSIRAGEVHSGLDFKNRVPLVCAVLRSKIFQDICRINLRETIGKENTTTTIFKYDL